VQSGSGVAGWYDASLSRCLTPTETQQRAEDPLPWVSDTGPQHAAYFFAAGSADRNSVQSGSGVAGWYDASLAFHV